MNAINPTARDIEKSKAIIDQEMPTKPRGALQSVRRINLVESVAFELAQERAILLAEVLPVIQFYGDEDIYFDDVWSSGTHLEDSTSGKDTGKRARALLARLKEFGE